MAKHFLKAGLTACVFGITGLTVSAQTGFESTGLGKVDPWGIGVLSRADGALPSTLWKDSETETLSSLFAKISERNLTPLTRDLLRRIVLSSSQSPDGKGDGDLLAQRLKLIWALGELDAYREIAGQMNDLDKDVMPAMQADLETQFLRGNLASACSSVRARPDPDAYFFTARAACFALQGDISSAELALELGRDLGIQQPWLISVFAALGEQALQDGEDKKPEKRGALPPARFDTGLNASLSLAADLPAKEAALAGINPGYARLLSERSDVSRALRIQAADIAAQAGLLTVDDYRRAYRLDPVPAPSSGTISIQTSETEGEPPTEEAPEDDVNAPVNPLDDALQAAVRGDTDEAEHVRLIRRALALAQSDQSRFVMTARALAPDMTRLGDLEALADNAERFSLAALIAGDAGLSARFQGATEVEGGPKPDLFMQAWLNGLRVINGSDRSPASAVLVSEKLAGQVKAPTRKPVAGMMSLFLTLDKPISSDGRTFFAKLSPETLTNGRSSAPMEPYLLEAGFKGGSVGEALLRTIAMVGGDASKLNVIELNILVDALKSAGYEDEARALAIEGLRLASPMN